MPSWACSRCVRQELRCGWCGWMAYDAIWVKEDAKAYPRQELHVVVDYSRMTTWQARHPRITVHLTPTSGSWLHLVEV